VLYCTCIHITGYKHTCLKIRKTGTVTEPPKRLIDLLLKPSLLWQAMREYFTLKQLSRLEPVKNRDSLTQFLNTRASFVAQTSLYGYLRTRAGMRYPELFEDDDFVNSINIAKWQIWLDCLSDLTIYCGGLLMRHPDVSETTVSSLMEDIVENILAETGIPQDAGEKFSISANHVRQRVATCDWKTVTDDEQPFSDSPPSLVRWAPIIDELKQLDEDIVINSVRFRWQKVRREIRRALDTTAVLNDIAPA